MLDMVSKDVMDLASCSQVASLAAQIARQRAAAGSLSREIGDDALSLFLACRDRRFADARAVADRYGAVLIIRPRPALRFRSGLHYRTKGNAFLVLERTKMGLK